MTVKVKLGTKDDADVYRKRLGQAYTKSSGLLPPAVRMMSDHHILIERPPTRITVEYIGFSKSLALAKKEDPRKFYSIPVPWNYYYIVGGSRKYGYAAADAHFAVRSEPWNGDPEDLFFSSMKMPNLVGERICSSTGLNGKRIKNMDTSHAVGEIINSFWNSGFNTNAGLYGYFRREEYKKILEFHSPGDVEHRKNYSSDRGNYSLDWGTYFACLENMSVYDMLNLVEFMSPASFIIDKEADKKYPIYVAEIQ